MSSSSSHRSHGCARDFIQAKRNMNSKSSVLFQKESAEDGLLCHLVKAARQSGVLNLANRSLQKIPSKVWHLHVLDEHEHEKSSNVSLDNPAEKKWWEFVDLRKLIVANNCIKCIPSEINLLSSLQTLDAHDNQITTVASELGHLGELHKLDLSHNRLKNLPIEVYNLKKLVDLKLQNNQLETISKEIGQLSTLKQLDLSYNSLVNLPDDLGFLSLLRTLNISNNKLAEIPHDIGGLTGLRELDISENMLTNVPLSFSDLIHLEILRVQNNKFDEIPSVFGCPNLKELYLENNQIKEFLSEKFINTKIELLDLRNNKIQNFVVNKEDLEFLDRFYLENNNISELPNGLALLPCLKHLSLEGNPLRGIRLDILKRGTQTLIKYLQSRGNIPVAENDSNSNTSVLSSVSTRDLSTQEGLGLDPYKLKNTRVLSLVSRHIKSIDEQVFLTTQEAKVNKIDLSKNMLNSLPTTFPMMSHFLNELNLDFNQFTSLPSCIGEFASLQFLSFQNNKIEEIPNSFAELKNLREINFGYNKFTSIPLCLCEISSLEIIIATNNKIKHLEVSNLERLSRLAVLDLRNNDINQVPPELGLLTQLRSLHIEGNAFRVPGYAILSKGTDAVLNYLRNQIEKK